MSSAPLYAAVSEIHSQEPEGTMCTPNKSHDVKVDFCARPIDKGGSGSLHLLAKRCTICVSDRAYPLSCEYLTRRTVRIFILLHFILRKGRRHRFRKGIGSVNASQEGRSLGFRCPFTSNGFGFDQCSGFILCWKSHSRDSSWT
jgi:hypothetical protein